MHGYLGQSVGAAVALVVARTLLESSASRLLRKVFTLIMVDMVSSVPGRIWKLAEIRRECRERVRD